MTVAARLAAALVLALAPLATALPASAAPPSIEVSTDGQAYAPTLSRPLFAASPKVIPGGPAAHDRLWLRHTRAAAIAVVVHLTPAEPDVSAPFDWSFAVADGRASGSFAQGAPALPCVIVPVGASVPIDLAISLPWAAGNATRSVDVRLAFSVEAFDAEAAPTGCVVPRDTQPVPSPIPTPVVSESPLPTSDAGELTTAPAPTSASAALTEAQIQQRALDGVPSTEASLAETGAPATAGVIGVLGLGALGLGIRLLIPWARRRGDDERA